jgi:ADP-ribosylglycohydrolase
MTTAIADILYSAIIGDAVGYTLNGMKKNHIKAIFRDFSTYINPEPGLKNNMYKWKKAGLYSSISQNIMIISACIDKKNFNVKNYINAFKKNPEIPGSDYGIFRDPGEAEKNFILTIKDSEIKINKFDRPCSRILPPIAAFLLIKNESDYIHSVLKYITLFTKNSSTLAYSLFYIYFLYNILEKRGHSILETACNSAGITKNIIKNNQVVIFNSGINPDYILSEIMSIHVLFRKLKTISDIETCEKIICSEAEKKYNQRITRASINLPDTILPMSIVLSNSCPEPAGIFTMAVSEGGASSSLTSLSASITTAFQGKNIPEKLLHDLINKKKISMFIENIAGDKNRESIITDLYNSESGLTIKELEEFKAKTKNLNLAKHQKKKKPKIDVDSHLSRHIVESWTKLDKAKWKKERNKTE